MKLSCEIVKDLLPLYMDEVCSPESRKAVEEHMKACESCRKVLEAEIELPQPEPIPEALQEKKRGTRALWRMRLTMLLSAMAVILVCILLYNQSTGQGLTLTNWDDIYYAKKFANHLEAGELEEAAEMIDFRGSYDRTLYFLSLDRDSYSYEFQPMEIGGETWYFIDGMVNNFDEDKEYTDFLIWEEMIFGWGDVIPMDVWNDYVENHAEKATIYGSGTRITRERRSNNVFLPDESALFYPVQTPWGEFMLQDYLWEVLERSEKTLADYGRLFHQMPESMYLEVKDALDEYAEEKYRRTQDTYGYAADMTLEEYSDYSRQKYLKGLEELYAQGYTLEAGGIRELASPSNVPDRMVLLDADLMRDGESFLEFPLRIDVVDGKVVMVNCSCKDPYVSHELLQPFEIS